MPNFFKNLKIKTKLFFITAVCLIGFTFFSFSGYVALDFIKVNGLLYKDSVRGKDAIAHVLPPPKYIIEAYLATFQMLDETSPEGISRLLKDSVRLKREYAERQQFWLKDLFAGEFFRIRDEEFIPLVLSGQTDKARELASVKLKPLYELHRKYVDRLATIAREMNARNETYRKGIIFQMFLFLFILGLAIVSIGIVFLFYLFNQITIPLSGLTQRLTSEGFSEEIAKRKQIENELFLARQHLEEQVKGRTAQLQRVNEALNLEIEKYKRARAHLDTQYTITDILMRSSAFSEAIPEILECISENMDWDFAGIWLIDQKDDLLRCVATWYRPAKDFSQFDACSRKMAFSIGVGLPGRVWASKEAVWIPDVTLDPNFPRASIAAQENLHGGFCFPVQIRDEVLGVLEFFSRAVRQPDQTVLDVFTIFGSQIGQFIEDKRSEERINKLNAELELRVIERTSDLQLTNKELHAVNAMNQALLQALPFPMGIVDEQGTILSLSPRLEALIGKEAIGGKCWLFYKDNKEQCLDCPLKKGVSLGQTETIETSGAFGEKIFSISHTGILFQGKKAILEVYQDVSQRRRQEEELRNAYEKLKTMQAQLVQSAKMASLGQLAGGVAHEINNPLTGVLNNIQLVKMELEAEKALNFNDLRDTLDVIEESALRCASIVRSLLDFSHSAEEVFLPLSLNDIAGKIIALIGHEMMLHNIAIEKQFEDGLPLVLGDSQLLQQAIFDIVSNAQWAIRRKSDQGGLITIKTEYEPQMSIVSLSVYDTGIGISKENLEKLFEPFFTTKPIGEGTGLGLAIVYSIVKKHSGNIEAVSELGQGATFKISLPAVKKRAD